MDKKFAQNVYLFFKNINNSLEKNDIKNSKSISLITVKTSLYPYNHSVITVVKKAFNKLGYKCSLTRYAFEDGNYTYTFSFQK